MKHETVLTDEDYVYLSRSAAVNKHQVRAVEQAILAKQAEKAQPPTPSALLEALERIADQRNTHFAGDAQVVAREAIEAHKKGQL